MALLRATPPGRAAVALGTPVAERLGVLLRPQRGHSAECEGLCNPGGVRGPDGHTYLFPRAVGAGNYSRIACARLTRTPDGTPAHAVRLGWALEPDQQPDAPDVAGCEDGRVTYLPLWHTYVLVYTALGQHGPRLALAYSRDARAWRKAGTVRFAPASGVLCGLPDLPNKDGALFPTPVRAPDGQAALCLLHRPIHAHGPPSMWLSYVRLRDLALGGPLLFGQHTLLARPERHWEADRVGAGPPPVLTAQGWLLLYHGCSVGPAGRLITGAGGPYSGKVYCAGALVLDRADPRRILARSTEPLFGPRALYERSGTMPNVVFPTAIEPVADQPGCYDVYYGAADYCCAALRLGPIGAPSQPPVLKGGLEP